MKSKNTRPQNHSSSQFKQEYGSDNNNVYDIHVDILIVGSGPGATGFATAKMDQKEYEKKSILIIERGKSDESYENISTQSIDGIGETIANENIVLERPSVQQEYCDQHRILFTETNCLGGGSAVNGTVYTAGAYSDYDNWPKNTKYENIAFGAKRLSKSVDPDFVPKSTLSQQIISNAYKLKSSDGIELNLFTEDDLDDGKILEGIGYQRTNVQLLDKNEFWFGYRKVFFETTIGSSNIKSDFEFVDNKEDNTKMMMHQDDKSREVIIDFTNGARGKKLKNGMYLKTEHEALKIEFKKKDTSKENIGNVKILPEYTDPKRVDYVFVKDLNKKKIFRVYCDELVLGAGALGTPRLLMYSGVGPEESLKNLGYPIPILKNEEVGKHLVDQSEIQWIGKLYEKPTGGGTNPCCYSFRNSKLFYWIHFIMFMVLSIALNILVWSSKVYVLHKCVQYVLGGLYVHSYAIIIQMTIWVIYAWLLGFVIGVISIMAWGRSTIGYIIGSFVVFIITTLNILLFPSFRSYLLNNLNGGTVGVGSLMWYVIFFNIFACFGSICFKIISEKYSLNQGVLVTNKPMTSLQVFHENIQLYFIPVAPEIMPILIRQYIFMPNYPRIQYVLRKLAKVLYNTIMPEYWLLDNLYGCLITIRIPESQGTYLPSKIQSKNLYVQQHDCNNGGGNYNNIIDNDRVSWDLDPKFLKSPSDKKTLADGLLLCRKLMKDLYMYELVPSTLFYPSHCVYDKKETDDNNLSSYMEKYIKKNIKTTYHLTGTCSMEYVDDYLGEKIQRVVDSENGMKLIGCENMKIVDASTFPTAISTSNSVTCFSIGYNTGNRDYIVPPSNNDIDK